MIKHKSTTKLKHYVHLRTNHRVLYRVAPLVPFLAPHSQAQYETPVISLHRLLQLLPRQLLRVPVLVPHGVQVHWRRIAVQHLEAVRLHQPLELTVSWEVLANVCCVGKERA